MRSLYRVPLTFGLLLVLAPLALAAPAGVGNTSLGKVLVNAHGMTLYTYSKDTNGKSDCNGGCAKAWPPLQATSGSPSGNWSIITRSDGEKQWAYKGKPLYNWIKDAKPGDTMGDGLLNGAWHVAQP